MLWTDAEIVTQADLVAIETNVASVIAKEGIIVSGPGGIVRSAMSDAINALLASFIQIESWPMANGNVLSGNHLAAVFSNGLGAREIPRYAPQQICVNSMINGLRSPIKTWVAYLVLAEIYQTAWNRRLKEDLYKQKLQQYTDLIYAKAWPTFQSQGLGVVVCPLAGPAAVFDYTSGTWGTGNVSSVAQPVTGGVGGSTAPAAGGVFDVAITYVDQNSQAPYYQGPGNSMNGNAESDPGVSKLTEVNVAAGHALSFSIASLIPPTGGIPLSGVSQGWLTTRAATGWNIYAGPTGQALTLQTLTPVPITQTTTSLSGDPIAGQYSLMPGQFPDFFASMPTTRIARA